MYKVFFAELRRLIFGSLGCFLHLCLVCCLLFSFGVFVKNSLYPYILPQNEIFERVSGTSEDSGLEATTKRNEQLHKTGTWRVGVILFRSVLFFSVIVSGE